MSAPEEAPPAIFSAAPHDVAEDLVGDVIGADLRVLVAGNQFMAMPDLVAEFRASFPTPTSVFYETLPSGVLQDQVLSNELRFDHLVLRFVPDVFASSPEMLTELASRGIVDSPRAYASNGLALLGRAGNPSGVAGWADVLRAGVRVAFPDPHTEGIGRLALRAISSVVETQARDERRASKNASGEWLTTSIHHRQGPAWLLADRVDVAVVWQTEARHHARRDPRLEAIDLLAEHDVTGAYAISALRAAPHPEAARSFVAFTAGPGGRAVFAEHGFGPAVVHDQTGATR